jgi:adenosylhomocysteine nucleosidase
MVQNERLRYELKFMAGSIKLAIVAALEREVRSFVKAWPMRERDFGGRKFRFFESEQAVLVCGGIGAEAAKRATEAVAALYQPELILSAGYAGALDPSFDVGAVVRPSRVMDAHGETVVEIADAPRMILVSYSTIADSTQKAKLASAYEAVAVDMEAASVARAAQAAGIAFAAIKVISDEYDAKLPKMDQFVALHGARDGQFRAGAFAWHAAVRPWLWPSLMQLAKNSAQASAVLARELGEVVAQIGAVPETSETGISPHKIENSGQLVHPKSTPRSMEIVHK